MKKKKRILLSAVVLLVIFVMFGLNNGLAIRHYTIDADGIGAPVRIVLIADLHSCRYGENEQELIEAVDAQAPDLVMLSGDIFDDVLPDENTGDLLRALSKNYPCYYVTGNHEYWSGSDAFARKMSVLEQYNITRLSDKMTTVAVNGNLVNICGVDDPDAHLIADAKGAQDSMSFAEQLAHVRELSQNGHYTILLSHRPESFALYEYHGFDLALCGHAHGGQWRLPGILNGLFAPNQGLFPKYAGGRYQAGATVMIVSRGLARESTPIPRFYDRPELVVVDLI